MVLIGALSVFLVQRASREREAARNELADANANLEGIVAQRTADLTEANEEIQQFAYIVSHDLRSPLVNIMGFTTELEGLRGDIFEEIAKLRKQAAVAAAQLDHRDIAGSTDALGNGFDEAISFIKSSITKMDRLINAVLKLSREGRRDFTPEEIDMNALLASIVQTVAHRVSEQGARIIVADLPAISSDPLAIEQIFSNLVDNALKYGRQEEAVNIEITGKIEITGRAAPVHVIYEVRDNGRGIAPHDHQRVFELFRRSGQQDRPGEGIGLAHVRSLVRRLGGTMGLESELGKGSVFYRHVAAPLGWGKQECRVNSSAVERPVTIVMIEDDEGHALLIEKNIRRAGVHNPILPFANGTDAVKFLFGANGSGAENQGNALLILLDLNLPDMSGVDILKRVKGNEHLKRCPVVVLTTMDDAVEMRRCYDLGCNVYITKPVNYENFANAIRQLGLFFNVIQVPAAI